MPKRVPISVAREVCEKTSARQVILAIWDGERTHIITYGKSVEDCQQAAVGGNVIKRALGWPEELCNAKPRRGKSKKEE